MGALTTAIFLLGAGGSRIGPRLAHLGDRPDSFRHSFNL